MVVSSRYNRLNSGQPIAERLNEMAKIIQMTTRYGMREGREAFMTAGILSSGHFIFEKGRSEELKVRSATEVEDLVLRNCTQKMTSEEASDFRAPRFYDGICCLRTKPTQHGDRHD
jgi:hypothetical protein